MESERAGARTPVPSAVPGRGPPEAVSTKITPPARPERTLDRPRVTECFTGALGARLTLVTGAPGMGKTAAVREWVSDIDTRVAWLTVDAGDNDVREFQHDVVAAVRHVAPEATGRFDDIAGLRDDVVFVIDDFQVVSDTGVVGALRSFLEHKPHALHVAVVSRSDPPLPLARWRAHGELHEVREAQLRFRPDEARAYLAMFDDLDLDDASAATLVRRIEGWIAGLQLATISLRASDDASAFIERFDGTDRFIADFLLDDVLDHQPDDVRDLLLDTSVLDEFDAKLCAALTDRHDADRALRRVEAANLFLVRLDEAGTSLRYHTLFRDLLRSELDNRSPTHARALRERAATLVAQRGDRVGAVGLLVEAGNDHAAFALAMVRDAELDVGGRVQTRAALELLPKAFVAGDQERALRFADSLLRAGCVEEAAEWLTRAGTINRSAAEDDAASSRFESVWSRWHTANGDAELTLRRATRALSSASRDQRLHDPVLGGLGIEIARAWLLEGNTRQAQRALRGEDVHAQDPLVTEVAIPALDARVAAWEGRLRDAEHAARRALRFATTLDVTRRPAVLDALLACARVLIERDETFEARKAIDSALDLAVELSSAPYLGLVRLEETRVIAAERGTTTALDHLRSALDSLDDPLPRCFVDAERVLDAELSLAAGDTERAARRVATLPVGLERELLSATVDLATDDTESARARLDALQPTSLLHLVRAELLRAAAADDIFEQRRHVGVAARLAAPEELRRRFVASGPRVVRAARSLATSGELEPVTREFLDSIADLPPVAPDPTLVEQLTDRERSVLRYLTTPLDYRDIATELLISQNTLKTHVTSIHRKLGASSRAQAVTEAERLGLLRRP